MFNLKEATMGNPSSTAAAWLLIAAAALIVHPSLAAGSPPVLARPTAETERLVSYGRYLATIGVCEACHTPPAVSDTPASSSALERNFRLDPNWFAYLDSNRRLAGGVPFVLRFGPTMSGLVVTPNITPDADTGIGRWSEGDIITALRAGKRKDGSALFLFAPHVFYRFLSDDDALSLAVYLKSVPAVHNSIAPRSLPFPAQPQVPDPPLKTPTGRNSERAEYLIRSLVGCTECHSYSKNNQLVRFAGGDPSDPFNGTFRLGPDLPLRQNDKGFAGFPFPGYAILYAPNLTRFGLGGDLSHVTSATIVRAIREGIAPEPDAFGRPEPLAHVMMWQFYASMTDDDAYSIAEYLKSLRYIEHKTPEIMYFGDDWAAAFRQAFGTDPSANDRAIFGKP